MKKFIIVLFAGLIVLAAFTKPNKQTAINGTIEPADAVSKVWAVKENDSASVIPANGKFSIPVKPGNWTLIVEAIAPYKSHSQTVSVLEGGPADVGLIKLVK